MSPLLRLFLDLCLLRSAPQDVPAAPVLLALAVAAYVGVGFAVALLHYDEGAALTWSLLDAALLGAAAWLGVAWRGYRNRFMQTATALAGTGALLGLLAAPVMMWLLRADAAGQVAAVPSLLLFGMLFWNIAVIGHILRHALSVSFPLGVLFAVAYILASWYLNMTFFQTAS